MDLTPHELSIYEIGYEYRLQELREISIEQTYWMAQTLFSKKPPKVTDAIEESRKTNGFYRHQEIKVDIQASMDFANRVKRANGRR